MFFNGSNISLQTTYRKIHMTDGVGLDLDALKLDFNMCGLSKQTDWQFNSVMKRWDCRYSRHQSLSTSRELAYSNVGRT